MTSGRFKLFRSPDMLVIAAGTDHLTFPIIRSSTDKKRVINKMQANTLYLNLNQHFDLISRLKITKSKRGKNMQQIFLNRGHSTGKQNIF